MVEIRQTEVFSEWIKNLRDSVAKARVLGRIDRLQLGLQGDTKSISHGLWEIRINFGPGYRIYYTKQGKQFVLLLAGGDKSTQNRDIKKAKSLLENL
jgi:putative addiction module killer protein